MLTIDKNGIIYAIGFCIFFFGLILFLDELHEFGISFGPFLPDMVAWSIKPFEHWMWGILFMVIGASIIYWMYKKVINMYATSLLNM